MSSAVGFGPLPSTSTWYCRPDSVVVTPSLLALAARKALPSLAFVFALASRSAICLACSSCCLAFRPLLTDCPTSWACSASSRGSPAHITVFITLTQASKSPSSLIGSQPFPTPIHTLHPALPLL